MKNNKKTIYAVLIILLIIIGISLIVLIINNNKIKERTYKASEKEYIKILDKENYEITHQDNTKEKGTYKETDSEIIFNDSLTAIKKEDYLLIKDQNNDIYIMYNDGSKYDEFINNIKSTNISDFITEEYSKELKNKITKIEIDKVNRCFKYSLNEENISCLIEYKYYLKDYDSNICSDYENQEFYINIFAGSEPTCKKDYILKENFFTFEKTGNKYKTINEFTGY